MDWTATAIKELRNYELNRKTIVSLTGRLAMLESSITSPRVSACSAAPVHGGGNRYEDKLVSYFDSADELKKKIRHVKSCVSAVDAALEALTPCERKVLGRFYIHREGDYVGNLCEELHFERSSVYRLKKIALQKFIFAMYGATV